MKERNAGTVRGLTIVTPPNLTYSPEDEEQIKKLKKKTVKISEETYEESNYLNHATKN